VGTVTAEAALGLAVLALLVAAGIVIAVRRRPPGGPSDRFLR
jgi:hypothetical protein